ncbi:MAG TPA: hypothetical protein VE861_00675, partial [Gemmatimonadaceae bacterium]|nr:hypothetical protein [Gemmatimonadaceae bacterium]
ADVYSLAALGFELLAGTPPFTGTSQQVMSAHVVTPAPSITERVPACPSVLGSAIMQGLAKDVEQRPDAETFARLLNAPALAADAPSSAAPTTTTQRTTIAIVASIAIMAAAAFLWNARRDTSATPSTATAAPAQPGLGVLPFQNIGGSGDDAYFAAGLTAELTTAIGKVPGLRIASQSTVRAYADSGLAPSELARRLGVSALVEGSAQRAGDRLRVTARLVDAADGHTLWSERYDRTVSDVFATQSEISNAIVAALAPRFGTAATAAQTGAGTTDLDAYDSFLRGRFAQDARDLPAALALYRKALARDSNFARAWAGIAEATAFLPVYGQGTYTALSQEIRRAASAAIRLDSTLAEPHTALGLLAKGTAEWTEAERELRTAAELQPRNGTARQILAELLFTVGRLDDSEREMRRAAELEPMNGVIIGEYAYTQLLVGQLTSARATIARALGLDARNPFIHYTKGVIDERAGDFRAAVTSIEIAAERAPQPFFIGVLARSYRLAGDTAAARKTRARLQAMSSSPGTSLARAIDTMGDAPPGAVLSLMEAAVRDKDPFMYLLPMRTWLFDPVRADPRFAGIVASLGLPPLAATAMPSVTR